MSEVFPAVSSVTSYDGARGSRWLVRTPLLAPSTAGPACSPRRHPSPRGGDGTAGADGGAAVRWPTAASPRRSFAPGQLAPTAGPPSAVVASAPPVGGVVCALRVNAARSSFERHTDPGDGFGAPSSGLLLSADDVQFDPQVGDGVAGSASFGGLALFWARTMAGRCQ